MNEIPSELKPLGCLEPAKIIETLLEKANRQSKSNSPIQMLTFFTRMYPSIRHPPVEGAFFKVLDALSDLSSNASL